MAKAESVLKSVPRFIHSLLHTHTQDRIRACNNLAWTLMHTFVRNNGQSERDGGEPVGGKIDSHSMQNYYYRFVSNFSTLSSFSNFSFAHFELEFAISLHRIAPQMHCVCGCAREFHITCDDELGGIRRRRRRHRWRWWWCTRARRKRRTFCLFYFPDCLARLRRKHTHTVRIHIQHTLWTRKKDRIDFCV